MFNLHINENKSIKAITVFPAICIESEEVAGSLSSSDKNIAKIIDTNEFGVSYVLFNDCKDTFISGKLITMAFRLTVIEVEFNPSTDNVIEVTEPDTRFSPVERRDTVVNINHNNDGVHYIPVYSGSSADIKYTDDDGKVCLIEIENRRNRTIVHHHYE